MNTFSTTLRREFRVSFSKRAQPVWFRVTKWIVFLAVCAALYHSRWFWVWVAGLPALGLTVHFFYRWKTTGWTRPWGGWNDVEAGRD